jgi:hypothetical protein
MMEVVVALALVVVAGGGGGTCSIILNYKVAYNHTNSPCIEK